jgi:hypothetical protein
MAVLRRCTKWLFRAIVIYLVAMMPHRGGEMEVAHMLAVLDCAGLPAYRLGADRGAVREQVRIGGQWNALMLTLEQDTASGARPQGVVRAAAVDHDFLTTDEVLDRVDGLLPLIACVARQYDIPPALVAGIIAAAQDLDYNRIDAAVDVWLTTGWLDGLTFFDIGAGAANIHYRSLLPVLAKEPGVGASPFARAHRASALRQGNAGWIRLSSRYPAYDMANIAVMARHYARLRIGEKPLAGLSAVDMAFVWSAYRGGVMDSASTGSASHDPSQMLRWALANYQRATDPFMLGDTAVALAYFQHYQAVFGVS